MIVAVRPWKPKNIRLQLQFFSWRYVGISCCNATAFVYRILFCQNIILLGPPIKADLQKGFQRLIFDKLLILLRDRPCLELIIVSSILFFQALLLFQDKLLESV